MSRGKIKLRNCRTPLQCSQNVVYFFAASSIRFRTTILQTALVHPFSAHVSYPLLNMNAHSRCEIISGKRKPRWDVSVQICRDGDGSAWRLHMTPRTRAHDVQSLQPFKAMVLNVRTHHASHPQKAVESKPGNVTDPYISIRALNSPQCLTLVRHTQEVPGTNWAGYCDHGFSATAPRKAGIT